MNCQLCSLPILATMQIMWDGYAFHPACIGEAVAQKQAEQERINNGLPPEFEPYLDEEPFDDEYVAYEENDDLEDIEDVITALDNQPDVDDEVLNQIPVMSNNGGASHVIIPEVVKEVHIQDIVRNVGNQFAAENGSKLMVHAGAIRVTRNELAGFPLPEETDTFKPIGHDELVNIVEEALAFRHIGITREEYAVTPDGMKFFSVLQVNAQYEGVNFAIGLRNSNNKSLRVGIVSGYRVFCCDNLAFSGDFNPMLQKHSKNLDLIESVSIAIDRIQRSWQPLRDAIDYKRNRKLADDEAMIMLYKLFTENKFPITLFKTVNNEFFNNPSFHEFKGRTLWSLENAATTAIKKLSPIAQYEQTARLGKFISQQVIPSV